MSRWRKIRNETIQKVKNHEQFDIHKENISWKRLHGTTYVKNNTHSNKGILLIHGTSGNRHGMEVLSERLAEAGYFCLSVDLPSHYKNPDEYTIGNICEMIYEGIYYLKNNCGTPIVSLVTHSIGAVAAIFSAGGYTCDLEKKLFSIHEKIIENIKHIEQLGRKKYHNYEFEIHHLIEENEIHYVKLKELILHQLKHMIQHNVFPTSYVMLAPPLNCKAGIPGLAILRKLPKKHIKWVFENLFHKPAMKQTKKEGNPGHYEEEKDPDYINWQFFKTKKVHELLEYMSNLKEAPDYISFIEDIVQFREKEEKVSFFEYYLSKYVRHKPKLFIYGNRDLYLKPFMPFAKKKIERFYHSCGNAEIMHGKFTHIMMDDPKQQLGIVALKNASVTEKIIRFLDKNM